MTSLSEVIEPQNLFAAWLKVESNQGCAGVDRVDIDAYGRNVHHRLSATARAVRMGRYVPDSLLRVLLAEEGKKPRFLAIPSVRDRVLQTAVTLVLSPVLEAEFETCSFGYRPGRSRLQAIERIVELRDAGFRWVVDADIAAYFDEVDQSALLVELSRHVPDTALLDLIRIWMRATIRWQEGDFCLIRGIAQGSPLSPLLANLYLDSLDEALLGQSLALVRYADDFVILCRDREAADDALELTEDVLAGLSLRLNERKTRVTNFAEGFHFLGAAFLREAVHIPPPRKKAASSQPASQRVPPRVERTSSMALAFMDLIAHHASAPTAVPVVQTKSAVKPNAAKVKPSKAAVASRPTPTSAESDEFFPPAPEFDAAVEFDPLFRTLHLLSPGLYLSKDGGRLRIRRDGEEVESLPGQTLNQIILHGH